MRQSKQVKSDKQKKLIAAILKAGRRKGFNVDDLRGIAHARYGCEPRLHAMKLQQLNNMLDYLNDKLVSDRASARQLWKIRAMATEMGWYPDAQERLMGFIKRVCRREIISLEQLKIWEASDVIEGLKHYEYENTIVQAVGDAEVKTLHIPDRHAHA